MTAAITFEELLADNQASTRRWLAWLEKNPAALDLPCRIFGSETVGGVVKHIFAVELRHSQRLRGQEVTPYEDIPTGSIAQLAAVHQRGMANLREFLSTANEAALTEILEVQTVSAGKLRGSRRKLVAHILLHSIRHWAQLATLLREQGMETNWPKDFFFSEAME